MDKIWNNYLMERKHLYLNNDKHLIKKVMSKESFELIFDKTDRKESMRKIKMQLQPDSYKRFINKYRVYKSRKVAATIQLSVSKYNFQHINTITQALGYQSNNETIELLCSFYAEQHNIPLAMSDTIEVIP